jgi:hypothetical protein
MCRFLICGGKKMNSEILVFFLNEILDHLDHYSNKRINHIHIQLIDGENPYLDRQSVFDVLKI